MNLDALPNQVKNQIDQHLDKNEVVSAIKIYKEFTKRDLKTSRDIILEHYDKRKRQTITDTASQNTDIQPTNQLSDLTIRNINSFLLEGKEIEAIKLYKNAANCSLLEAKNYIRQLNVRAYQKGNKDVTDFGEEKSNSFVKYLTLLIFCLFIAYLVYVFII